jgi:hypothetical protein
VNFQGTLVVAAVALSAFSADAVSHVASAESCMARVNKCSVRCELHHGGYNDPVSADRCEQNCNTAYNACVARNQPRRPLPSDPPPKHTRPANANLGNRGVAPNDPKHTAPANASSGSRSVRSSK